MDFSVTIGIHLQNKGKSRTGNVKAEKRGPTLVLFEPSSLRKQSPICLGNFKGLFLLNSTKALDSSRYMLTRPALLILVFIYSLWIGLYLIRS
jgi:hypothetical protein